jgi:hypothetical protein
MPGDVVSEIAAQGNGMPGGVGMETGGLYPFGGARRE